MTWYNPLSWLNGAPDKKPEDASKQAFPVVPPVQLPPIENLKYMTENPSIDREMQKKYFDANIQQISLSRIPKKDAVHILDGFDMETSLTENFKPRIQVLVGDKSKIINDAIERRRYRSAVEIALKKAEDGFYLGKVTSSTSNIETIQRSGEIKTEDKKNKGVLGFLYGK